jgi:hypothetical protein
VSGRYSPKDPGNIKKSVTMWPDTGDAVKRLADEDGLTLSGMIHKLLRTHPRVIPFLKAPSKPT